MTTLGPPVVFVDACVWYSRTLRDWLGMLYVEGESPAFTVHWTEDVMAELIYNLRRQHPTWSGARITGIRDRVSQTFSMGRVADFTIDDSYHGRDPLDAHVHAASIACSAQYLVTSNVADFVWDDMTSPYEVVHPDTFLTLLDDSSPELVGDVAVRMCRYWLERTGEANLVSQLKASNCPEFAHACANTFSARVTNSGPEGRPHHHE